MIRELRKIYNDFFKGINCFIDKYYNSLTCNHIFESYMEFFNILKKFRGTSRNFTGLSEYFILKFILRQLGNKFNLKQKTTDISVFNSIKDKDLIVGQGIGLKIDYEEIYPNGDFEVPKKKESIKRPDISIHYKNKLIAVIEIKTYLTYKNTFNRTMKKLKEIHKCYSNDKGLIIIYHHPGQGSRLTEIKDAKDSFEWFNYIILQKNETLFKDELQEKLALDEII